MAKLPAVRALLVRAHRENLAPKATLHYLTENPDTFGAIGVFSGPRSQGLVILDVDANLGTLERKYKADFEGPHIPPAPSATPANGCSRCLRSCGLRSVM